MRSATVDMVEGGVEPGWEPVADAFRANFASGTEVGAACAVYHRGDKVVDLWGGFRDPATAGRWNEDTLVLVFSTTKGMSSLAVAVAHSRGLFSYDEKVATYWPEFSQGGKADVTVRQLFSHQAGLCAIDEPMDLELLGDPDRVAAAIAKQVPAWEPGTRHGYHGISLGWYESELVRRVDPQHRTIGRFFADEVAAPLDLEFYIGLPDSVADDRIAVMQGHWYRTKMLANLNKLPRKFVRGFLNPKSITARTFANPKVVGMPVRYNDREMRRIELPASNGIGQVRSIAKAYGEFATGGSMLGIDDVTMHALTDAAAPPSGGTYDLVLHDHTVFSLGFLKPWEHLVFGSDRAFGTPGAGGSFGFADPDLQLGFGYAMNRMDYYLYDDPREKRLREAAVACAQAVE
ncbi:MAG: beta-lactamase family protein [Acidimicrobiia bacterium]|nr:beta-lactamase family protein [Acidimicrobiia bacterium]MDH5422418.1 beta-lactamase family protein [Acidimicrobiia bacterium]MDH5503359.1 beta-lactamase family protein [Acidimicrobiia bacterium]